MKPDLYGVLGVGRAASAAEIKAAHRKAAKRSHPDLGGTADDFAKVQSAAMVLCDPKARKHYDHTGEIPGDEPDTTEAQAMAFALQTVQAIMTAVEKRGGDLAHYDVLADCQMGLRDNLRQLDENEAQARRKATDLRKTAARFKAKKGKRNVIAPMMEAQARVQDDAVRRAGIDRAMVKRAQQILSDHEFDWSAPTTGPAGYVQYAGIFG